MSTLRQAFRQLSHRRGPTLASAALLALGVAFVASFYSLLDSALLSGLPFPGGDRMVAVSTREAAGWPMPLGDYRTIEATQRSFEWLRPLRTFNTMVTRGRNTKGMIGSYVPADLFDKLGVAPQVGRAFEPGDEDPSSPPVALISHRLWHGAFGADPGILGETIVVNREPTTVVGVMPAGFHFPLRHDVWGVMRTEGRSWSDGFVFGMAKLADGVSLDAARADLARIAAQLDEDSPEGQERNNAVDSFVRTNIGERAGKALQTMVWAALGLLLLTCANLANLRLSETLRRQDELDTRLTLGAGGWGLARLLLTENLLIGLFGGTAALVLTWLLTTTLGPALLAGNSLSRIFWVRADLDAGIAAGALALTLVATLLGALLPIVSSLVTSRRRNLGRAQGRASRTPWPRALVGAQVGLCFALLVGATLFGVQARELLAGEIGFPGERLSSVILSVYQADVDDQERKQQLYDTLTAELRAHPQIEEFTFASNAPWSYAPSRPVDLDAPSAETSPRARVFTVSEGFLDTLQLPLVAGRALEAADRGEDGGPVLISRTLADRLFEGEALGKTLRLGGRRVGEPEQSARVVGVVADLDVERADYEDRNLTVFQPASEAFVGSGGAFLLVRHRPGTAAARPLVEEVLAAVAPRVGTLDELSVAAAQAERTWSERRLGQVLSLFGLASLLLTAAGMYAVISVMVQQREHELGIRAAVGARPRDLRALVLGESGRQLAFGLLGGLLTLWAGRRFLAGDFAEALALRPTVLLAAGALVAAICLLGTWAPTRRAMTTDPSRALRAR